MAPTIAERAANGEVLHAPDLSREEQKELLRWARDVMGMEYKEIKKTYGFTQSESTLRGWSMQNRHGGPVPREPTFTAEDDRLLRTAIELFARGPLDDSNSYIGIWTAVQKYIRKNGGETTAGVKKLRERWNTLTGRNIGGAPAEEAKDSEPPEQGAAAEEYDPLPQDELVDCREEEAAKFIKSQNQAKGDDGYDDLTWDELVDCLGEEEAAKFIKSQKQAKGDDEYDDLTWDELVHCLGEEEAEKFMNAAEEYGRQNQAEAEAEDEGEGEDGDEGEDEGEDEDENNMEWGEYEPLSERERIAALALGGTDADEDSDDEA